MPTIFGVASVIFTLLATVPYLVAVLRGKIRPHPFTWFVWSIIAGFVSFVQNSEGAGHGSWLLTTFTIFGLIIFIASIKYRTPDIHYTDWIAVTTSMLCFVLYFFFGQVGVSIILITLIDVIAFYPTIRKSKKKPHREGTGLPGFLVLAYICSLASMGEYSIATITYPVTMVFMYSLTFFWVSYWRKNSGTSN